MNIQGWGWQQLIIFIIVVVILVWAFINVFPTIIAPFT